MSKWIAMLLVGAGGLGIGWCGGWVAGAHSSAPAFARCHAAYGYLMKRASTEDLLESNRLLSAPD